MNRRIIITACATLIIVFLVRWWIPSDRVSRSLPALPDTQFDYTLTDFESEFFSSQGELEWVIAAPSLQHDSATKIATIDAPNLTLYPASHNWRVEARKGLIYRNEDIIELIEQVVIKQPMPHGLRVMQTEQLHHDRRKRTIGTNALVEIRDPRATIRAGGMEIDLNTDTMEFFNRVQGELYMGHSTASMQPAVRPRSK